MDSVRNWYSIVCDIQIQISFVVNFLSVHIRVLDIIYCSNACGLTMCIVVGVFTLAIAMNTSSHCIHSLDIEESHYKLFQMILLNALFCGLG